MSNDLKQIISAIKFPVRYDPGFRIISGDNENPLIEVLGKGIHSKTAFGEELARLINTLDPSRESVSDEEITDETVRYAGRMEIKGLNVFQVGAGGFTDGALWMREQLSK